MYLEEDELGEIDVMKGVIVFVVKFSTRNCSKYETVEYFCGKIEVWKPGILLNKAKT